MLQVQFSPRDFQAIMKLLDSLSDGKTQPEPPAKEDTTPEPSPEDGSHDGKEKDEDKKSEEIAKEEEERDQEVSNIHVAANVGAVTLLLHSRKGDLAIVSIKSKHSNYQTQLCC